MIDKMINSTSEDLMRSVATGDEDAFKALVHRHQRQVLNLILRFLGDRDEAEDLTQEVFLKVWKSAGTYKLEAKFKTWLYRISINLCINRQRYLRIRRWFNILESNSQIHTSEEFFNGNPEATTTTPEDDLIQSELSLQVKNALEELPTSQRAALILKVYDDLSYHEISQILGRSISAVDSLLIRAKKNLHKKLSQKN
jgi:RNA polymerase sigma-70 factor, ECF subfamily